MHRFRWLTLLVGGLLAVLTGMALTQAAPTTQTATTVYVPLISTAPRTDPAPVPPAGHLLLGGSTDWAYQPRVALDTAGGLHLTYFISGETADGVAPGYYAYCAPAANCADPAVWQKLRLATDVSAIHLALTATGQPRVLIFSSPDGRGAPIQFAACERTCTAAQQWQIATIASTAAISIDSATAQSRPLALDAAGNPHFVYYDDRAGMDHAGTFYAFCDQQCTDARNWSETRLVADLLRTPSLQISPNGALHLLSGVNNDTGGQLIYAHCAAKCYDGRNWDGLQLHTLGTGDRSWMVHLDAQNRLHVALAAGTIDGEVRPLAYLTCAQSCLEAAQWQHTTIGAEPVRGQQPDLVSAAGQVLIAYRRLSGNYSVQTS
jgi:hypothetical protein